jgi:hypothetical protein
MQCLPFNRRLFAATRLSACRRAISNAPCDPVFHCSREPYQAKTPLSYGISSMEFSDIPPPA